MKHKKSIVFGSFLALTIIFIAFPPNAAAFGFEINLPAGNFVTMSGSMQNNDYLNWSFTSTLADIKVMILNNYEYNYYMDNDILLSTVTILSNNKRSDSGWWRPPYSDIWHLIFENVGAFQTHLVYFGAIDNNYFIKDILPRDLFIGYIGFFAVIGIGGLTLLIQRSKLKRI